MIINYDENNYDLKESAIHYDTNPISLSSEGKAMCKLFCNDNCISVSVSSANAINGVSGSFASCQAELVSSSLNDGDKAAFATQMGLSGYSIYDKK